MPAAKVNALTNLAGAQAPADLVYIGKSPFGSTDDRKSTLNDLFAYPTKNVTDKAQRFQGAAAPAVSGVNEGAIYYDLVANQFKVSQNGGAYANLINPLAVAGVTGSVQINNGAGLLDGDAQFIYDSLTALVTIGSATLGGQLRLRALTSGNGVTIKVDAPAGNHTYVWPNALPTTTGQALTATGISGSTITLGWQAAGVSGSGTTGALAKWTAATTLGDSIISESGTTVTVAGQAVVNQAAIATVGFTVQAVAAATAELVQIKDSAGSVRGGYSTAGAFFFRGFSSPPTNSLANDGKLYYDIGGGGLTQQLMLSKNTAVYNPVVVANQSSHINNRMARWSTTSWELNIGNVSDNDVTFSVAEQPATSGSARYFQVLTPASTGQTAATEAVGIQLGGNSSLATVTRQWATGAIATQREVRFIAPTYAFVGASVVSNAIGVEISSPIEGTNATFTIAQALRLTPSANAHLGLVVEHLSGATGDLLRLNLNSTPIVRFVPVAGDINTVLADSALGTTATDGFVHYPSMAGAPTGVPTAYTGVVPTVVDTTNQRFYGYIGGSWVNLSGSGSISGSGAAGRAAFWTGASSLSSNANFQWDNTDSRLLINAPATPGAPVHVKADSFNLAYRVTANAAAIDVDLSSDGTVGFLGTTTTHGLELWTDATTRVRIEANGLVGINNVTPGAQLAVTAGAAGTVTAIFNSAASPSVNILNVQQNGTNVLQIVNSGGVIYSAQPRTAGSATFYRIQTPADTTLTASTEAIGIQLGGSSAAATVTRQFSTGALTTQRENLFVAPTYAFVGASTITTAATVAISGAPVAGTNATITTPLSLWIQAGRARVDGTNSNSIPWFELGAGDGLGKDTNGTFSIYQGGGIRVNVNASAVYLSGNLGFASSAPGVVDVGFTRVSSGILRLANGNGGASTGTGSGSLLIASSSVTAAAQLHAVSAAAGTVAARFDSAASPTADIVRVTVNASVTGGTYWGIASGGTQFGVVAAQTGSAGGTTTLNLALGNWQDVTMPAGNTTVALSNIPNSAYITITIIQDATGSRTVTWPATIKWVGGAAPTLTTAANARDQFLFRSDGTNLYELARALDVK